MGAEKTEREQERARRIAAHQVWGAVWRQALVALNIGWDIGLPIVGGTVIGYQVDTRWGTGYTYTLGGMMLGLGVGINNAVRTIRRAIREVESGARRPLDQNRTPEKVDSWSPGIDQGDACGSGTVGYPP